MHWTWLLTCPVSRAGAPRYEHWLRWHYELFVVQRLELAAEEELPNGPRRAEVCS